MSSSVYLGRLTFFDLSISENYFFSLKSMMIYSPVSEKVLASCLITLSTY